MTAELKEFVTAKLNDLIAAPCCCAEARQAAEEWLAASGTETENEQTEKLLKELEEDIEPIDDLVAFTESDTAVRLFGEERAKQFAVHARELNASGAKYCDCPACAACAEILEKKGELL